MSWLTKRAAAFVEANKQSRVVYGSVTGQLPDKITGVVYRLENGQTFTLTSLDCKSLPHEPRWAI